MNPKTEQRGSLHPNRRDPLSSHETNTPIASVSSIEENPKSTPLNLSSSLTIDDAITYFPVGGDAVAGVLKRSLYDPLSEFLSRPKKSLRTELLFLGQMMAKEFGTGQNKRSMELSPSPPPLQQNWGVLHQKLSSPPMALFESLIEMLHSASLVVDDIEDESEMRRGAPTLHRIHGLPIALNAGNWLYFFPLHAIQTSALSEQVKTICLNECIETLFRAHTGQALDIGTELTTLDPKNIPEVIFKSIELKSGVLASLAIKLGALTLAPKIMTPEWNSFYKNLELFGCRFGQLLQFYDDIGNLTSAGNPLKRLEDLRLLRPSFVWVTLARILPERDTFQALIQQISKAQDQEALYKIIEPLRLKEQSLHLANHYKNEWLADLERTFSNLDPQIINTIHLHMERLTHAYS